MILSEWMDMAALPLRRDVQPRRMILLTYIELDS